MTVKKTAIVYAVIAVFFLLDLGLKQAFVGAWQFVNWEVMGGWFSLRLAQNPNMAFSLPLPAWLIISFSILFIAVLIALAVTEKKVKHNLEYFCYLIIILGALSNLYDRLILGQVIDYLDFMGISVLNLADVMISVGVTGLLALIIFQNKLNNNIKHMAEVIFTDANFEAEALKSDLPVLVDCYADWCGPCKMQGPIVDELSGEMAGKAKVGKLNVDQNSAVAEKYGVMSIPTILLIKGGEVKKTLVGLQGKEALKSELEKLA